MHLKKKGWLAVALVALGAASDLKGQLFVNPQLAELRVPRGFAIESVVQSGLTAPIDFCFMPDGRLLIAEQWTGEVKTPIGGVAVAIGAVPQIETLGYVRGLVSITLDPDFPARPFLYSFSNHLGTNQQRVLRQEVIGYQPGGPAAALQLGPALVVVDGIPDFDAEHNGGTIRFGPDGRLYVSTGDDFDPWTAQDVTDARGAILRLDVEGLPAAMTGIAARASITPSDNPHLGLGGDADLVWAKGLRNPFRFAIDRGRPTTEIWIADVGKVDVEEVSFCASGGLNFGWPWYEGTLSCAPNCPGVIPQTFTTPAFALPHPLGQSIIALDVCRPATAPAATAFGADYDGDVFVGDFIWGTILRLRRNGNTLAPAPFVNGQIEGWIWGTGFFNLVAGAFGPDGSLYVCRRANPAQIQRVRVAAPMPGNGTDLRIDVRVAGIERERADLIHDVAIGDPVELTVLAPGGSFLDQPFVVALEPILAGYPMAPLTLPGDPAPSLWVQPDAVLIADGFSHAWPNGEALLAAGGFTLLPFTFPPLLQGVGLSFVVQAMVFDGSRANGLGVGLSHAVELRLLP